MSQGYYTIPGGGIRLDQSGYPLAQSTLPPGTWTGPGTISTPRAQQSPDAAIDPDADQLGPGPDFAAIQAKYERTQLLAVVFVASMLYLLTR